MVFPVKVKRQALDRQSKNDGYGSWCACCGTSLERKRKQAVARIPLNNKGRKNLNNCVMVCGDCYTRLTAKDGPPVSSDTFPYAKASPPDWETEKRR
ncbi:MAG: hypothetical protein JW712_03155 [Dehalococcoidales bacterium]|nr:hypothetical protein [Dehalococcoidales bacterium]